MTITWESKIIDALPIHSIVAVVIVVGTAFLMYQWKIYPKVSHWNKELRSSKSSKNLPSSRQLPKGDLKNIWDERRKNGIDENQCQSADSEGRPFGSNYYFAHHKSSSGGYKDGLRMEDYAMNGPRLLSKQGQTIDEVHQPTKSDFDPQSVSSPVIDPTKPSPVNRRVTVPSVAIPINRYLFEDPADATGIITIRIESLPTKDGKQVIPWKDARVIEIKTELVNSKKGLSVKIDTKDGKYRLYIPTLYGNVDSVKSLSKEKRLLVRLQKTACKSKKNATTAWPYPYTKST